MAGEFAFFPDLGDELQAPESGRVSLTIYDDDHVKVVLFGMAAGDEFSTHAAPMATSLYFVKGDAELTLGDRKCEARPGTYVQMAPKLPHAIIAKTPVVMMLQTYKQNR
jgi:quercetin dioxygenase-like cupin family protein